MSEPLEDALQQAMVHAYDHPRDVPDLAGRVVALHGKRRRRQRVAAAGTASLLVALAISVPLLVRGDTHRGSPATTTTGPGPAPTAPAEVSASFAELAGWWRFTHLQAPGGSVPVPNGGPAYLHFDSETSAVAEIGGRATRLTLAWDAGHLRLTRNETQAILVTGPGYAAENRVEGFLDHLAGSPIAEVSGDDLTVTGPDGAVAQLVRTAAQASPGAWSCCQPTADPPPPVTPEGVPPCSAKDLTGSLYPGGRPAPDEFASSGDTNQLLIRTTGAAPCLLGGPVTLDYLSASGPVTPLHPGQQQSSFEPTVLSPTALTPAQDANVRWSTALWIRIISASTYELRPSTPCAARDQVRITSIRVTFDVGTITHTIPRGLTTCERRLAFAISSR